MGETALEAATVLRGSSIPVLAELVCFTTRQL
jgi:hypothetical protein